MIRIKAVDAQNILDVCRLRSGQRDIRGAAMGCSRCAAVSVVQAQYDSEIHPNVIYNNNVPIGFFMYRRAEDRAETAAICRFMVDDRFRSRGLEEKALEHILRGLKIQGVRRVTLALQEADQDVNSLYLSLGFHLTDSPDNKGGRWELDL